MIVSMGLTQSATVFFIIMLGRLNRLSALKGFREFARINAKIRNRLGAVGHLFSSAL